LFNWSLIGVKPRVTIANLVVFDPEHHFGVGQIVADARRLPFRDGSFDIVFSNSLIEHLGTSNDQALFASEAQRVGRSYYVQTPAFSFPIEPHFMAPFVHWLPTLVRIKVVRRYTIWGIMTRPSIRDCEQMVREIRLLRECELRVFFPDAVIRQERVLGLTKSLIALGPAASWRS
jgi:SAM-dependent methyltransferase